MLVTYSPQFFCDITPSFSHDLNIFFYSEATPFTVLGAYILLFMSFSIF